MLDYLEVNKKNWDNRTKIHLKSNFYDLENFKHGKNSLKKIELDFLKEVKGLSVLHLQCHFGQDSMSLSRLGAQVVGVDFSDIAIEEATKLAHELNMDTTFICSDIYELPKNLDQKFDLIFTSYGTIGWLPDLTKWAEVIAFFLKKKGKLILVDFHPFIWTFDSGLNNISYHYFNIEPIVEMDEATYADKNAQLNMKSISWNHPISEILMALIAQGLTIKKFEEFDFSPYNCFENLNEEMPEEYRFAHINHKIPMVYAVEALKQID